MASPEMCVNLWIICDHESEIASKFPRHSCCGALRAGLRALPRCHSIMVKMMKISYVVAILASVATAPAFAQAPADSAAAAASAPTVSRGALIFSAEGRRIGRVDRVRGSDVSVIYNGKFVSIPTSSLSAGERGLTTSLTQAELGKL